MESPNKRQRMSDQGEADFVPLGGDDEVEQYGYGAQDQNGGPPTDAPTGPRNKGTPNGNHHFRRDGRNDPRNAKDRPKSKHILPGYEPWILVRTKYGRRFAHNTQTKESFWFIPKDVMPGVLELERRQKEEKEQAANARWAEEQLKEMEAKSAAAKVNQRADAEQGRSRRRRSESLQMEDEEAFMAELAKQAEEAEEQDAKEVVEAVEHREENQGPRAGDYASDSDYEYVEVTDTEGEGEGEDGDEDREGSDVAATDQYDEVDEQAEDGPVEFGEDDIAYQLAAMGQDYGLDPEEYAQGDEDQDYDEGLPLSEEDALALFHDMLSDHRLNPFTPWDKILSDESPDNILMDDRFTVLPSSKARKEAWDAWTKERAAAIREERARMAQLDPKIPYLAFLAEKASPKLYWPEFKRKYRKEAELNDRKLSEKDREKLYRDHINRLKLPESIRKADLTKLLKSLPLSALNNATALDTLPQALLSNLHFISVPARTRDALVEQHIQSLPEPPADAEEGEMTEEQRAEAEKKRGERRKREAALAERERKVQEEKRRQEVEERRAKGMLRESERDLGRY